MDGKYKLKNSTNGQFYWTLHGGNGEPLLTSETFTTKQGAGKGIASAMLNSGSAANYDKKKATNGSPYFTLKAGNYEVLGTSEMYSSEGARDTGISACMKVGPTARTEDLT